MVIYYFHDCEVGFTRRFMSCHGVVRLVSSNGYIYYFHGSEVGFTRRFDILGLPQCREVGLPDGL